MSPADVQALLDAADARDAKRTADMPTERHALHTMFEAFQRLKELGWREAMYAPRDGRALDLIEVGSTGIHQGHCREVPPSDFPMKWFWIEDDDLWPSTPILYRERAASRKAARTPAADAEGAGDNALADERKGIEP